MLRDTNAQAQVKALLALENSDPKEALSILSEALNHSSTQVRLVAVNLLAKICGTTAIQALTKAMKNPNAEYDLARERNHGH